MALSPSATRSGRFTGTLGSVYMACDPPIVRLGHHPVISLRGKPGMPRANGACWLTHFIRTRDSSQLPRKVSTLLLRRSGRRVRAPFGIASRSLFCLLIFQLFESLSDCHATLLLFHFEIRNVLRSDVRLVDPRADVV